MDWHTGSIKEVIGQLHSDTHGLSESEIASRRSKYGFNLLHEKKKKSIWWMFFNQFRDLMIVILLAAAFISGLVGDIKDAIVILIIVVLNAVLSFVQEYKAEKAIEALKKMTTSFAKVRRQNDVQKIPATELVPGDIVLLEAGDMLPADMRIISSYALKIDESSLTGESISVEKSVIELEASELPIADRSNMVFKSTQVVYGRGEGIVVETGMQTEIGKIAMLIQGGESQTPLQKRLTDFSKKLSVIVLVICMAIYLLGILRGEDSMYMLLTAISVAVAAIPESLPAVITITLALGARSLVKKNALIRKLNAVETLGSVTYICSDKTGTLTQNKMSVKETKTIPNTVSSELHISNQQLMLLAMSLNHDTLTSKTNEIIGDPTEIALVEYSNHLRSEPIGIKPGNRKYEIPFDSERKMMTTVHHLADTNLIITKGALESVLKICLNQTTEEITQMADDMAGKGMRVIAYAVKIDKDFSSSSGNTDIENKMHFLGIVGMMDPARKEAKKAVEECINAGIVPVMITGDHPLTATAIAKELGILKNANDKSINGSELAKLSQASFEKNIRHIKVYARVSPEQKLRIVSTLQAQGQFVAVTGDGVNDAPALKHADIGIAMGITGTDVSKQAAHMILIDDNFATIVNAIREGRRIYANIKKFIKYVLTCNGAEIWIILLAPFLSLPIPLLPIHILWINLVTDGLPGISLASEKSEIDVMKKPPRKTGEQILQGEIIYHVLWVGMFMALVCLGFQHWEISSGNTKWQTMVFTVLCFSQMGHVLAIRSERLFLFRQGIFTNLPLIGSVLLTFMLQLAIIYIPIFQDIFKTMPLSATELLTCMMVSSIVFHGVEFEKFLKTKFTRTISTN